MWNEAKQSLGSSLNPNEFFLKLLWSCFGKDCYSSATQALLCYLGCLLMKRLWVSPHLPALMPLNCHTHMIWCHLFRQETLIKVPGWCPPSPSIPMSTLWTATELLSQAPSTSLRQTENLTFTFIHCHYQLPSNTFLFLFSGQRVKELLYNDFVLLGSLSSGLLQPESRLLLHLPCTVTVTEMSTRSWTLRLTDQQKTLGSFPIEPELEMKFKMSSVKNLVLCLSSC